jgi:hypothetical protein
MSLCKSDRDDNENDDNKNIEEELVAEEEKEIEIPELLKGGAYEPKIVDEEKQLVSDFDKTRLLLEEDLKLIDMDLDLQIFNAPNSDPRMTLDIKKLK